MAQITLHRADRIMKDIRDRSLKIQAPKVSVKVSVFAADPATEISAHQKAFSDAVEAVCRMVRIEKRIRAAVDQANAAHGLVPYLRQKQAAEDILAILNAVPGVAPPAKQPSEEEMLYRRRDKKTPPPPILDRDAAIAMIQASRARYATAEGTVSADVEISVVDLAASEWARGLALEARREADRASDELRTLNATFKIEVDDGDLDWLAAQGVSV